MGSVPLAPQNLLISASENQKKRIRFFLRFRSVFHRGRMHHFPMASSTPCKRGAGWRGVCRFIKDRHDAAIMRTAHARGSACRQTIYIGYVAFNRGPLEEKSAGFFP